MNRIRQVLGWLLLTLLMMAALALLARTSALWSLQQDVQQQLPASIARALVNAHDEQAALQDIARRLQQSLSLQAGGRHALTLLQPAQIVWAQLQPVATAADDGIEPWRSQPQLISSWPYADSRLQLSLQLNLPFHWPALLLSALLLSAALLLLLHWLPGGRFAHLGAWRAHFRQQGYAPAQAAQLASTVSADPDALRWAQQLAADAGQGSLPLDDCLALAQEPALRALSAAQLDWLRLALLRGMDWQDALPVALHAPQLRFDLAQQRLWIHGLEVTMAKTPLFYYFWYARRRVLQQGLYVNPGASRPDHQQGIWLAGLMERWGGHAKAINDLREAGLKGKTLDQNRNKIKDELTRALGELALPYLFEAERDLATARYRYGLTLPAGQLLADPPQGFRDISECSETSYSPLSNTPA